MMTSVRLQNFKGHRDTTIPLGRMTVLVGPNGSGKTSVLEALQALGELVGDTPMWSFQGDLSPADVLTRGSRGPISIAVEGRSDGAPWNVSVQLEASGDANAVDGFKTTVASRTGEDAPHQDEISNGLAHNVPAPIRRMMRSVLYRFDTRKIAAAAFNSDASPVVEPDGTNTAVVLAGLKLEREEEFDRIEAELRKVVPSIERIRVRRVVGGKNTSGYKIHLDVRGAPDLPAHVASDGTLVTLALLTALCGPTRPRLLLLDDLDHSLHPKAQVELIRELRRLLGDLDDVQIVATTHSPYVLDELDPADVHVFALRDDGSVAAKRLSEHPDATRVPGALSAGQIWSLDPERSWVIGEGA